MDFLNEYKILYSIKTHDGGDWVGLDLKFTQSYIDNMLWDDGMKFPYVIISDDNKFHLDRIYLFLDINSEEWHYLKSFDFKIIIGKSKDKYILVHHNSGYEYTTIDELFEEFETLFHSYEGNGEDHSFLSLKKYQHMMYAIYHYNINNTRFRVYLNYPYGSIIERLTDVVQLIYKHSKHDYEEVTATDPLYEMNIVAILPEVKVIHY
jgi:hypothetical protein